VYQSMTDDYGIPKGPNSHFWFGADGSGRDLFVRVLYGARTSLFVAGVATTISMTVGVTVGVIAGFYRGWVDTVISRVTEITMAFPQLLFIIALASTVGDSLNNITFGIFGQGVFTLFIVFTAFGWFYPARIVRAQIMSLRNKEFVEAAQMVGARDGRIMRTHLLPHVVPPLLAYGTLLVATNIMIEVGVTFLGAGIKLPTASWGSLLAQTWGSILSPNAYNPATTQPWLTLCPSIAIFLTVFALNQFGEGLREATDPRSVR